MEQARDETIAPENCVRLTSKGQSLVDQATEPILILNNDGGIVYGNEAAQTLLQVTDRLIHNLHFSRYFDAEFRFSAHWERLLERAKRGSQPLQGEWQLCCPVTTYKFTLSHNGLDERLGSKNIRLINVEYRIMANIGEGQHLVMLQDITARKQADQKFLDLIHHFGANPQRTGREERAIAPPLAPPSAPPLAPPSALPLAPPLAPPSAPPLDGYSPSDPHYKTTSDPPSDRSNDSPRDSDEAGVEKASSSSSFSGATSDLQSMADLVQLCEDRYAAVINTQTELICRFLPDGTLTFVNNAYCQYFEKPANELIGESFLSLVPDENQPSVRRMLRELETLTPDRPSRVDSHAVVNPDGTTGWQEWKDTAIFDADDRIVEYQGVGRDISDYAQALLDLELLRQRLLSFMQTVNLVGLMLDHDGNILFCNDYLLKITGWTREEVLYQSWFDLFLPPEIRHTIRTGVFDQALHHNDLAHHYENEILTKTGDRRLIAWNNTVFRDHAGNILSFTSIGQDITDQRRAEQTLHHENQLFVKGPTVIFKWTVTEGWPIEYVSPNVYDVLGYRPEELVQEAVRYDSLMHPDDIQRVHEESQTAIQRTIASDQEYGHSNYEYRLRLANGDYEWFHEFAVCSNAQLNNGASTSFIGYVRNIHKRKQAELARQDSEEKFRALFEQASVGMTLASLNGTILRVNSLAGKILGYAPSEIVGRHFQEFTVEAFLPENLKQFNELVQGQRDVLTIEKQYRRQDGSLIWCYTSASLWRDADGNPKGIIGALKDISDRKRAEQSLAERELTFRSIYEQNAVGIAFSKDNHLLQANQAFCMMLGYTEDELKILSIQELTHPDDWAITQEHIQRLNSGEADSCSFEKRYIRRNGTILWGNLTATVIRDEQGNALYCAAILQDITARKRSEEAQLEAQTALAESEERLRLALEGARMGLWDWNLITNRIVWSPNLERIMGLEPGQFDGTIETVKAMMHPKDRDHIGEAIARALTHDEPYRVEFRFIKPDGSVRWALSQGSVYRNASDQPIRMAGLDLDITQRKELELSLARSQQQYQSLINSVDGVVWEADFTTFAFTFVSPQAEQLLGYPVNDWLRDPEFWQNHIHPDDREYAVQSCVTMAQQGRNHIFDYRMIRADGNVVWVRDIINVTVENGKRTTLQGILLDITDEKAREEELRQYKRIVSATPDAIALLDSGYRYVVANQAYLTWHGIQEDELIGQAVYDVMGAEVFHHTLKPRLDEALTGNIIRFQDWFDFKGVGQQFASVTYAPYFDRHGAVMGIAVVARDITGLKRAEIALYRQAEQEQVFTSILNRIRQTLNLQTILDITVAEVRDYLNADRVLIYEFAEDMTGVVIAESVSEGIISIWGRVITDHCFTTDACMTAYRQGRIQTVSDIHAEPLDECYANMLANIQVRANLVVPILQNAHVWGLLVAQQCLEPHHWNPDEVDFLKRLSDPLAVAITQSQLYEQTFQQARQEALLNEIVTSIRNSLNLETILKHTVSQLLQAFQANRAIVSLCHEQDTFFGYTQTVSSPGFPVIEGALIPIQGNPHALAVLAQEAPLGVDDVFSEPLFDQVHGLLERYKIKSMLAVSIRAEGQIKGIVGIHQGDRHRHWTADEQSLIKRVADQLAIAITQSQLYEQTVLQARRETLLNDIVQSIRASLDLNDILQQTTQKVLNAFQSSRALVSLCSAEDDVLGQSKLSTAPGIMAFEPSDVPISGNPHLQKVFAQDTPIATHDVFSEPLLEPVHALLHHHQIQSMLIVSIRLENEVRGILSLHQCDRQRYWTDTEQILLKQVADQLAIAIQQAELYTQVQSLNANLESDVRDRTADLEQALAFEALLKRITDTVRDSLDEDQIFEDIVRKLADGLDAYSCDTSVYDQKAHVAYIQHEYIRRVMPASCGREVAMADFDGSYDRLLKGETLQMCWLPGKNKVRLIHERVESLTCPVMDDQEVLGDIWLYRDADHPFTTNEIHLVEQVANQCAIAIRQARLFEAAQAQVVELERLNRLKDDFLSTISHELRTPMASIKMAIQMFEIYLGNSDILDDTTAPTGKYFQILKEESDREITLINNLLDLTRLDDTDQPLLKSVIQLNMWVTHISEVFLEQAQKHRQHLVINIPDEIAVYTDLSYLERMLTELFTNACKYTPEGECITLSADVYRPMEPASEVSDPKVVRLMVCNTGVELPPEECDRIFDKFYRVPNNDPWKYSGSGMGLALVKKLATAIGATIWAESSNNEVCLILELPTHIP
jgi:PAS domain S-box-containing protein